MPTLLQYAVMTDPFPLYPVVAQLTIVATNATDDGVALQGVSITIPVGDGAAQLTADTKMGPVPPSNWTLADTQYTTGAVEYDFQPEAGSATVGANESLVFVFNSVEINQQPGTCEVVVMEGSNDCQPPDCPTAKLDVTKFPNGWGTVLFWVNPPIVPYDGTTTLNWSGPSGATYTIEYYTPQTGIVNVPRQGQPALSNEGQYPGQGQPPLQLEGNTFFYLTVVDTINNQTYSAQQQIMVTVEEPPPTITLFTAKIKESEQKLNFQWQTQQADHRMLSGVAFELDPSSPPGGYDVPLSPLSADYTLTAMNSVGTVTSTLTAVWTQVNQVSTPSILARDAALSPDGSRVYVSDSLYISVFEPVPGPPPSLQPVGSPFQVADLSAGGPQGLALSPDGTLLYVVLQNLENPHDNLFVVDVAKQTPIGPPVAVPSYSWFIAVSPDGSRVYVTTASGTIVVFTPTNDPNKPLMPLGSPVQAGSQPAGIAVSPDGSRIYVGDYGAIWVFESTSDPDNPLTLVDQHSIEGFELQVAGMAVLPCGSYIYAVLGCPNAPDSAQMFDAATINPVSQPVSLGGMTAGMAIASGNLLIYVAGGTISPETGSVLILAPTSFIGVTGK